MAPVVPLVLMLVKSVPRIPCHCFDDPDTDAFQFRTTRTGRTFSEWQQISTHTFNIAAAVVHSLQLSTGRPDEDLSELDSGPPLGAISTVSSMSPLTWVPATASTSTASPSAVPPLSPWLPPPVPPPPSPPLPLAARRVTRRGQSANTMRSELPPSSRLTYSSMRAPHHPRHFNQTPVTHPGLIRDKEGMVEDSVAPTHRLPDFFGPQRCFQGFQYIPYSPAEPIVDTAQKVCAVFGGMPDDPNFMRDVHDPAVAAMEAALQDCCVSEERCSHQRGNFPQLTKGDSMGGGQKRPRALVNGVENTRILNCLTVLPAFIRLAGFATGVFANWAPRLFDFYVIYMTLLYTRYTHLYGGHLVLWDCKLVIEFPPGCTILIPSAAIYHFNIPIGRKEHRYSFTQYTAGGLFRWVEHDFKTEEEYFVSLSAEQAEEEKELGLARAEAGAGLYSTIDELRAAN
ncbi:hypothetical protein B0H14DRAFT_3607659 [Mycena olivaceomarginata]|nr:hypothetical protein B0H14DRAFT_3607659 [Mycena olivaceomarginata]